MYCVVMAGGSGTRFWPKSREKHPKQFLRILDDKSLIQSTLDRFGKIVGRDKLFIVAKGMQETIIRKHAPGIPDSNFIFEPVGKNTAPCIGLAAVHVAMADPDAVMIVTPADHLVKKEDEFQKVIHAAALLAEEDNAMVTLGITPARPSTGYGYIQIDGVHRTLDGIDACRIKTFAEKPNYETAERFVQSGDFFWNSGIFVFKASVILQAFEEHLPELYESLMEIRKALQNGECETVIDRIYHQIKSISIDYGVMEQAKNVFMIEGNFIWNDLGSWDQVYKLTPQDDHGNAVIGDAVLIDTKNSYVDADGGVVAVLGLDEIVVVRDGDAVLVCKRKRSEEVKHIVDRLKRDKMSKYL
jgi:mannose-1-phosphate guanylyltransferase